MTFECPYCSIALQADPSWTGRSMQCPGCGWNFIVPKVSSKSSTPGRPAGNKPPTFTVFFSIALVALVLIIAAILLACWSQTLRRGKPNAAHGSTRLVSPG